MQNLYNEDYFERGSILGISGYRDYRWIPELTIPMAHYLMKHLDLRDSDKILDFGCAKGFLVKAFRLLGIEAYGYDISEYCIKQCDADVRDYVSTEFKGAPYDWLISKDVFEHLDYGEATATLEVFKDMTSNVFIIVPLAEQGKYRVPAYEEDKTHMLRMDEYGWRGLFASSGWRAEDVSFTVKGVKDNYAQFEKGNGFFKLVRKDEQ